MGARYWKDLTTTDFAGLDFARTVAVLPVAATEQHGPHLPLGTDTEISRGVLSRVVELAPADLSLLILPTIELGLSPEHRDFPGTLTLSPETLLRTLVETGESVRRTGLRKIVFFNSHGGQPQLLEIAAQELRTRHAMAAMVANCWRMMRSDEFFPAAEKEAGLHAGGIETSLLLHLAEKTVRRDRIADFPSSARTLETKLPEMASGGRLRFAWQTQDLNPAGAVGDARLGKAEIGRAMVDHAAQGFVAFATDLAALPLDVLRKGALPD